MSKLLKLLCLILALTVAKPALAYNFLYIHPTTGEPIGWEQGTTIRYYLDPGSLGRLTNDQARTLVEDAMKIWESASSNANVPHFEFAGYLSEDVNGENYQSYVDLNPCYTDDIESCPTEAQKNLQTVIIFDEDDAILDNELCQIGIGCSANAGAKIFLGSSEDPQAIAGGIAVFGGTFLGGEGARVSAVIGLMVHELGHLLGLAHTTTNQEMFLSNLDEYARYMPTMIFSTIGNQYENETELTLSPDDIAGISVLYPSETFESNTATIEGQILKSDGSRMPHVNVIAWNVDDPLCEAFSLLSGRSCYLSPSLPCGELFEDPSLGGNAGYSLFGLPPGSYTIEVEEVADDSLAWTLAPGLLPDEDIYGDAEFWNEGDAADDPSYLTPSTITLTAGETRENVDIILNRSEVTDDRIQYIPMDTFTPGPGTRCPEEPPVNYAEMIGIDEGGTTDDSDGATTSTSSSSGGCSLVR